MSVYEAVTPELSEEEKNRFYEEFEADPYPFFSAMRDMGPIMRDPVVGLYHVTGKAEMDAILKDSVLFSSSALEPAMAPFFGSGFPNKDGKEHARGRGLVSAPFTPAAIAAMTAVHLEPVLGPIIDRFRGRREAEFVEELCFRFPLQVIASMLGVPLADQERFRGWYQELMAAVMEYPRVTAKRAIGLAAAAALRDYLRPIVREHMASPGGRNLISALTTAELEGSRLSEEEILNFARGLLFAGAETTRHLLANAMWGVLATGRRDDVRRDARLLDGAIEEGLRFLGAGVWRTPTRDTTIGGVDVPQGAILHLAFGAYHFDPAHFPEPEKFKVDRFPAHLAFGAGRHICLGAHLARAEARIALSTFFEAFPNVRLDPSREVRFHGGGLRSPLALHVLLD
jgi:pulcherriminic acid synthase